MAARHEPSTDLLEQKLQELRSRAQETMPADKMQSVLQCFERMRNQPDGPKGLDVGKLAPDFVLSEPWGAQFWLKESLATGPTIVVFYRGTWCPFCEVTLSAWQALHSDLKARGIGLVAVSPQYPEASGGIVKKLGLEFPVLCDPGNRVARKFDVVYKQEAVLQAATEQAGADLARCNMDCSQELPIPATFLIAQNADILYRHFDVDYTRRADPSAVLSALAEEKG